ncbi:hypothetical protein ANDA3_4439 [plant metagenome]|uniref:Uncharacterized protein n=1 Tax=plant metagenome TaxID=1297885 RepID=A0A484PNH4_9ZZZZ
MQKHGCLPHRWVVVGIGKAGCRYYYGVIWVRLSNSIYQIFIG